MKEYKHNGETFRLDNTTGCRIRVTYHNHVGYVLPDPDGHPGQNYSYCTTLDKDGNRLNGLGGCSFTDALNNICGWLARAYQADQNRKRFSKEHACQEMNDLFDKI